MVRGCLLEFYCLEKTGNLVSQMAKVKPLWKVSLWTRIEGCAGTEAEQRLECLIESRLPSSGTRRRPSPLLQRSSRQGMRGKTMCDFSSLHEGFIPTSGDSRRRQWHPTPVLLPGKSHGEKPGRLQSMGSLRVGHDLCDFTFTFHFHALEKEMASHSSVLAWRIPGTGEPGGLPSMGSHRVGHD